MKKLVFCFCAIIALKTFAQKDSVSYYFNSHFNVSPRGNVTYIAAAKKDSDDTWNASITNINTKNIVVKGHYNDSLFSVPVGKFFIYSDDGKKQEEGIYNNGKKHGLWLTWDNNGNLTDSAYYENDEGIIRTAYNYDGNGNLTSTLHEDKNLNTSIRVEYDSGRKVRETINNFNDHSLETKVFYASGQLRTDMVQKKDKFNTKYYDENGKALTQKEYEKLNQSTLVKISQPEFPGGIEAFSRYIIDALKRNRMLNYESGTSIVVNVSFFIDSTGKPYDIQFSGYTLNELTQTVIHAMETMPHWKMNGWSNFGPVYRKLRYIF